MTSIGDFFPLAFFLPGLTGASGASADFFTSEGSCVGGFAGLGFLGEAGILGKLAASSGLGWGKSAKGAESEEQLFVGAGISRDAVEELLSGAVATDFVPAEKKDERTAAKPVAKANKLRIKISPRFGGAIFILDPFFGKVFDSPDRRFPYFFSVFSLAI